MSTHDGVKQPFLLMPPFKGNSVNTENTMLLKKGEVMLVRSENVKSLGDHYIIITGPPVMKPHGLRPQTVAFSARGKFMDMILNTYNPYNGVIALQLNAKDRDDFHSYYGISIVNDQVIIPEDAPTIN